MLFLLEHLFYSALSDCHVASGFGEVELLDCGWLEDRFFLFLLFGFVHIFHDFVHLIETLHPFDSSFFSFLLLPLILRSRGLGTKRFSERFHLDLGLEASDRKVSKHLVQIEVFGSLKLKGSDIGEEIDKSLTFGGVSD